jgi:ribosomal protein S12 methylthiotransferase accessory factor
MAGQAFDPSWLCLYAERQYQRPDFPYRPFDPNRALHWTEGYWLDTHETVLMPAFATHLNGAFDEEALCQVTSNGLAAGDCLEDAARRPALELYEPDAFLASWSSLRPGVAVALDEIDPQIAEIVRHLEGRGAKLEVYLVAQGNPAFVAVCAGLGDGRDWPAVTLGLGGGGSMRNAVSKAILEHGQTGPFFARIWRNRELPIPASAEQIRTLQDHALYYCDPNHAQQFHRWRNSVGNRNPIVWDINGENPASRLKVRIAIADLTPPDVAEGPFRVVRAIARGLQPIYYGCGFERTYTSRLQALLKGHEPNLAPPPIC